MGVGSRIRRIDTHLAEYRQVVQGLNILPRTACPVVDGDVDCGKLTEQCATSRYDDRVVNAAEVCIINQFKFQGPDLINCQGFFRLIDYLLHIDQLD